MQHVCSLCGFRVLQLLYLALRKANNAALRAMCSVSLKHSQNTQKASSKASTSISTSEEQLLV